MRGRFPRFLTAALLCLALCPALATASSARPLELITPADPVTATVYGSLLISFDGTDVLYTSLGPMPGALGGNILSSNQAVRGRGGWTTEPKSFPYSTYGRGFATLLTGYPLAFSTDFSTSIWVGLIPLTPDTPETEEAEDFYRLTADGLELLAQVGGGNFEQQASTSSDTQHVIFPSPEHLLPADGARTEGESIYEIDGTTLRLVDVDSAGGLISTCGSIFPPHEGMSRSGSRVFFTSPAGSCGGPSKVYLREDATTPVPISSSHCARVDCNAPAPVRFAGATPDGSTAFMTTTQQLVDEDHDETRDLYAYDVPSAELRLLSDSAPGGTGEVLDHFAQASEDGSSAYFFAQGRLLPGLGQEGGTNLYLANGSGLHFVAPLATSDPLQISRSGGVAAFATRAALVPTDTDEVRDVYVYRAGDASSITRVSAGLEAGNGSFEATIESPVEPLGLGVEPDKRALSADGGQVFFSTAEQLLPVDHNGALDVYGWGGAGLELISPGTGDGAAEFTVASGDGSTAIFRTNQTLLPEDRDGGERDLYAARVGGGFPTAIRPPGCSGESCLPPAPAPGRVVRHGYPSEGKGPQRAPGKLRLGRLSPAAGAELVERGFTDVRVRVPGPGAVVARAVSRAALAGKPRLALRGVAGAVRAGSTTLRLRSTDWAKRTLRREGILRLRISLRQAQSKATGEIVLKRGAAR